MGCSGTVVVFSGAVVSSVGGAGSSVGGVRARHAKRKIEAAGIKVLIFISKPFLVPIIVILRMILWHFYYG